MIDRPNLDPALYPSDLQSLKSVFDQLCQESHIQPGSPEAENIASELVRLFQDGISDETCLLSAARTRHQDLRRAG
ncbi:MULTISPECIES: hypothetical protein [Mesorhizobium]|uniref:DUF982 domain-containing protein n=2 Tax=Mesorhizobium TaxID=68287 RepID=A0ABV2GZ42_9HYPH|nr:MULTISPECIES: hypothetical protein [Mesorhizobium]MCV3211392.1 hypothetical protein [Mesorhizobium sp. YC-2]MCV3233117.1 hypothetical protein [Mesorhizobium sp. YC-39]MCV3243605.1 hypothetical protein [Mesorhizobium sp. ZC-5]